MEVVDDSINVHVSYNTHPSGASVAAPDGLEVGLIVPICTTSEGYALPATGPGSGDDPVDHTSCAGNHIGLSNTAAEVQECCVSSISDIQNLFGGGPNNGEDPGPGTDQGGPNDNPGLDPGPGTDLGGPNDNPGPDPGPGTDLGGPNPAPGAGASGDPHINGANGDKFDFKGLHDTIYNLLSWSRVTLNALFQHKTYSDAGPKHREVHGSYMTAGFAAIKTNADRLLHIGYDATRAVFIKVAVNGTEPTAYKAPFSMTIDDVSVALADRVATIATPEWSLALSSKFKAGIVAAGNTCASGKCFLEVKVSPRTDVTKLKVAPHGLIGQTYDGDGVGVIGKMDDYKTRDDVVTTSAMGEGAIEGGASDYEMASKYATDFKFSRFGLTEAKPRDATKLSGQKVKKVGDAKATSAGAA